MTAGDMLVKALTAGALGKLAVARGLSKAGGQTPREAAVAARGAYAAAHSAPDCRDEQNLREMDDHIAHLTKRERADAVFESMKAALGPSPNYWSQLVAPDPELPSALRNPGRIPQ